MTPRHFPSHSPPWWPKNEPWPPAGPANVERWRQMRNRIMVRIFAMIVVLLVLTTGACTFLFWLIQGLLGATGVPPGPGSLVVVFLLFVIGIMSVTRALRRFAMPVGDLMEATGRVAEGDYSARVAERGSRDVRAVARAFNEMVSRLQANDAERRNLLADVTHELRTPLTVIQGNLEGLLDGIYPRDDAHLAAILEETRVLSRLVDDLRTLALAESGALHLQKEPTDLGILLNETRASFRAGAEQAGIELIAEVQPNVPSLQVDPARIRQVLENILANALRFTPRGGTIRVSCSARDAFAAISVSDTGVGISADDLPHIFDRFYKSRSSHGSGLGLAIAKNLVAAHGGEITAHSEIGRGTTIRFTLPTPETSKP
ncbi:MAG: HAMP domain-containing histidine kinase [Chloroflexi bacterium]|nr:HAMP domain-containing histidine kinase [Chloroflexota bacterium]